MKIKFSLSFREKLLHQVLFIAKDKPEAARKFKSDLLSELKSITISPYSYRKSIFFNDEQIRDKTFKGYTITFRIKPKEDIIEVFGFYKYTNPDDKILR